MKTFLPALAILAGLAGCTTAEEKGSYPSLAPRPQEKLGFEEPAAPPPKPVVADPALDAVIADATAKLVTGKATFDRAADDAASAARSARGSATGSERWIEAQTRLATLDSLRADTSLIVTDLDERAITRATTLAPEYPALEAARTAAHVQSDTQAARIAEIQGQLAPL